ncbi:hypothetical protein E1265_17095 [Streptomyces sp. 8K308]|uniref:hypothetical protein n=1 Tax=Streptomyces sp. 8K308 TaxID=2530388 RepID=UPI00104970D2|nr:hypothetical protein [Streptomyces sp. 8K308]TDC21812.1 hypothetical protein E1265_17095 [Streptomyces sp. 8K308]
MSAQEAATGLAQLEGFLLWQTELSNARREAEAFAEGLPWLTTAQREQVIEHYAHDRISLSHRMLTAVADRCHSLQDEYTARYHHLKRRLVLATLLTLTAALTPCTLTFLALYDA